MLRRILALVLSALCLVTSLSCSRKDGGAASGKITIAVIPKGTTHEFWKSVHAGAVKASRELGVDIVWKGPVKEDDLKDQIDVVQSFTAQGVSGIVLAPLNDKALGGKGKVVLLRYQEGSASTANREQGFLEGIKKSPEIQIVSDNQYGGATTESAFSTSERLLGAQKAADGGVNGVFCPNESTTFGMLLALQKAGLAGKIKLVGFDSSPKLVAGLASGQIDGLVLQDPFNIGYLAVKTMVQHLKGEKIEARIDTGARLVTKENMNEPATKELLSPDLEKWLKK